MWWMDERSDELVALLVQAFLWSTKKLLEIEIEQEP